MGAWPRESLRAEQEAGHSGDPDDWRRHRHQYERSDRDEWRHTHESTDLDRRRRLQDVSKRVGARRRYKSEELVLSAETECHQWQHLKHLCTGHLVPEYGGQHDVDGQVRLQTDGKLCELLL